MASVALASLGFGIVGLSQQNQNRDAEWRDVSDSLNKEWAELSARFLPIARDKSIWRFSHLPDSGIPEQGWKLHVSATVLTACTTLRKIAPLLQARGVHFKAPVSLEEVKRINSGLHYGYSQVGKLITIYPRTAGEAVDLAQKLYELTGSVAAPGVPFDQRFRTDGCVYYRYGAFKHLELENPDGTRTPALRDPQGRLHADVRDSVGARPEWLAQSLIEEQQPDPAATGASPLETTYRVFRALSQRGKGGVYQALDLSTDPVRFCVLKEGRRRGELSWDGRDGTWRIRNEERALNCLREAQIDVPTVYGSFELEGNYYLATEFMEGENLQAYLLRRQRRLSLGQGFYLGAQLAFMLIRIHRAGWIWRDCKPGNLILSNGTLRPLDFEGACLAAKPDSLPWGTPGFTPNNTDGIESTANEDLYGLGATLYFMLTGRLPLSFSPVPIAEYRRGVSGHISDLILGLLNPRAPDQFSLEIVGQELQQAITSTSGARSSRLQMATQR